MSRNKIFLIGIAHSMSMDNNFFLREEMRRLSETHDIVIVDTEDSTNNDMETVINKLKKELPPEPMKLTAPEYMPDYSEYSLKAVTKPHEIKYAGTRKSKFNQKRRRR